MWFFFSDDLINELFQVQLSTVFGITKEFSPKVNFNVSFASRWWLFPICAFTHLLQQRRVRPVSTVFPTGFRAAGHSKPRATSFHSRTCSRTAPWAAWHLSPSPPHLRDYHIAPPHNLLLHSGYSKAGPSLINANRFLLTISLATDWLFCCHTSRQLRPLYRWSPSKEGVKTRRKNSNENNSV